MLKVGDVAPDFTLTQANGKEVKLSQFQGQKAVVLYFYPKDETPVCTIQACSFRDSYEDFKEAGAEVIGISDDAGGSHDQFASKHRLPFILLSDPEGLVRKLYGVTAIFGLIPGRVTFVIDKRGKVVEVYDSHFRAKKHVQTALVAIRKAEPIRDTN